MMSWLEFQSYVIVKKRLCTWWSPSSLNTSQLSTWADNCHKSYRLRTLISFSNESSFPLRAFLSMTFMACRSPGRSLLSANLTCEKAPLNTSWKYSYKYIFLYTNTLALSYSRSQDILKDVFVFHGRGLLGGGFGRRRGWTRRLWSRRCGVLFAKEWHVNSVDSGYCTLFKNKIWTITFTYSFTV